MGAECYGNNWKLKLIKYNSTPISINFYNPEFVSVLCGNIKFAENNKFYKCDVCIDEKFNNSILTNIDIENFNLYDNGFSYKDNDLKFLPHMFNNKLVGITIIL